MSAPLDLARVHRLPRWLPMAGITLFGRIFAKNPGDSALLAHELVHVRQQERDGWRFYLRYVFSARWRVRYEAEAYREDVSRGRLSLERAARILSGPLYLWPCSYYAALRALKEVME